MINSKKIISMIGVSIACLSSSILAVDSCPLASSLTMSGGYVVATDSSGLQYKSVRAYSSLNPAASRFYAASINASNNVAGIMGNPACRYLASGNITIKIISAGVVSPSGSNWNTHGNWVMCSNPGNTAVCPYNVA